jgi:hypothetical protein
MPFCHSAGGGASITLVASTAIASALPYILISHAAFAVTETNWNDFAVNDRLCVIALFEVNKGDV